MLALRRQKESILAGRIPNPELQEQILTFKRPNFKDKGITTFYGSKHKIAQKRPPSLENEARQASNELERDQFRHKKHAK